MVAPGSAFGNAQAQAQARQSRLRAADRRRQSRLGALSGVIPPRSHAETAPPAAGGSGSGAQVLQNGIWSDPASFSVETLQVTGVSPASAGPGSPVTITGTGFGNLQGTGAVWLGSTYGQVMSWSDTQVVAVVAPSSLTGIVRIQQNNVWSNALTFTLPGNTTILVPNLLNMAVGDTATVQASSLTGQPLTGLTWTSSDPTVVSLSTDDPPVLTAVAPGHVTIVAGTASVDVTVTDVSLTGTLPIGTVIWSNPGDGSGVDDIVPAVPSPTGVADVFAFNSDGAIQAIRSDGTTAWMAHLSSAFGPVFGVPDFLGGMVAVESQSGAIWDTIVRLDGMTGQPSTLYTADPSSNGVALAGLHPDGTVFAFLRNYTVIGIDPTTGAQKFSVPLPQNTFGPSLSNSIIAGDGNFYLAYITQQSAGGGAEYDLKLLQVSSSGASATMTVTSWLTPNFCDVCLWEMNMITNADTGIVLTWTGDVGSPGMAVTTGTSVSVVNYPSGPNGGPVVPVLQAQDGSFIGTVDVNGQNSLIAFDQAGNLRWSVPGNWGPQIATADGGSIATDDSGTAITFDQNGNATGQMAALLTQSWTGQVYHDGMLEDLQWNLTYRAASYWANRGANQSATATAVPGWFPPLPTCNDPGGNCQTKLLGRDLLMNAKQDLVRQLTSDQECLHYATTNVFNLVRYGGFLGLFNDPIDGSKFINYLQGTKLFYDGPGSAYSFKDAACGIPEKMICPVSSNQQIRDQFGPAQGTTAVTVSPSLPYLLSFWQPEYTFPQRLMDGTIQNEGFGVGINPSGPSQTAFDSGVNIYNESTLFHEAIHGFTGLLDPDIYTLLGTGAPSVNISIYIKDNVLSHCPTFR